MPAYRHVPGLTPHPVRHPEGHLFGIEEARPSQESGALPEAWKACPEYLFGIDLFNRGYLWEAHEAWELVWIGAGKSTGPALFVQGLIQISAAMLRKHLGTPAGAHNLMAKAWERIEAVSPEEETSSWLYMGLRVRCWQRAVERYLADEGAPFPFLVPVLDAEDPTDPKIRTPES